MGQNKGTDKKNTPPSDLHKRRLDKITGEGKKEMKQTGVFPMHKEIDAQTRFEKAQKKQKDK